MERLKGITKNEPINYVNQYKADIYIGGQPVVYTAQYNAIWTDVWTDLMKNARKQAEEWENKNKIDCDDKSKQSEHDPDFASHYY